MASLLGKELARIAKIGAGGSIAFLLSCAIAGCAGRSAESSTPTSASTAQQDFTARGLDGSNVRLSDHLGKRVIMIDFWSTYCQPCLAMFPHVKRIQETYKDRGFVVLAISMDPPETMANVPAYAQRNGLQGLRVLYDEDSHIASLYNPKKVEPFIVVIDKAGRVVKTHEGFNSGDEILLNEAVRAAVQ